jgi:hypothetical protein
MKLSMTKAEAAKIGLQNNLADCFGELSIQIGATLERALRDRLTEKDGDETFQAHITKDGRIEIELGPLFGFDEKSESTPSFSFDLIDLVKAELEFGVWVTQGKKEALTYVTALRDKLTKCAQLIDHVAARLK